MGDLMGKAAVGVVELLELGVRVEGEGPEEVEASFVAIGFAADGALEFADVDSDNLGGTGEDLDVDLEGREDDLGLGFESGKSSSLSLFALSLSELSMGSSDFLGLSARTKAE